jgi:uncharacterized small protein (DUF1192 family)
VDDWAAEEIERLRAALWQVAQSHACAQAEVARLTAELGDLPQAQAEMLSEIKALRAKNRHLLLDANARARGG